MSILIIFSISHFFSSFESSAVFRMSYVKALTLTATRIVFPFSAPFSGHLKPNFTRDNYLCQKNVPRLEIREKIYVCFLTTENFLDLLWRLITNAKFTAPIAAGIKKPLFLFKNNVYIYRFASVLSMNRSLWWLLDSRKRT